MKCLRLLPPTTHRSMDVKRSANVLFIEHCDPRVAQYTCG